MEDASDEWDKFYRLSDALTYGYYWQMGMYRVDGVTSGPVGGPVGGPSGDGSAPRPVAGASVVATVLRESRGEKIIVFKKKRTKNHTKRTHGHRQDTVELRIDSITV